MFESKINRGRANGYAPLDGSGKVSLSYLPDVVGVAGTSGTSGVNGSQGSSGASGTAGSSGTSGISPFGGIDTGSLVFKTSVPTNLTGSSEDSIGLIAFDKNSIYYCSSSYVAQTYQITVNNGISYNTHVTIPKNQPGVPNLYSGGFSITTSGNTTYVLTGVYTEGDNWDCEIDNLNSNYNDGTQTMTLTWLDYQATDIWTKTDFGFERGKFATTGSNQFNGNQSISGSLTVSSTVVNNATIDAVNTDLIVDGGNIILSGSFIQQVNYTPFGSGSWFSQAIGEVTELDITKDIHLIDITGFESDCHFYLPSGLYDGQVIRFALKGDGMVSPNIVYIWMDALRRYDGFTETNANWSPFWNNNNDTERSLATVVYIDGAWNTDSPWFNQFAGY